MREEFSGMPLIPLEGQIQIAEQYLQQYRQQQVAIDTNITLWFEAIIESLYRLKDLEQ